MLAQLAGQWVDTLPAYACDGAAGLFHEFGEHPEPVVVGDPAGAVAVLNALVPDPDATPFASVPATAAGPLLRAGWRLPGPGWAFRWTAAAPALPVAGEAAWLDDEDEVRALLAEAFPDASLQPGSPHVRRWAGLRRAGRLVACAADATLVDDLGFLASIASHPDVRGTGAGAAVTAWATGELVRAHGRCGLWLMADNAVAAALYTRLGYRDDHPMAVVTRTRSASAASEDQSPMLSSSAFSSSGSTT